MVENTNNMNQSPGNMGGGGALEVVMMRIESLRVEAHRQQDMHFRTKLQLEEQMEENEVSLHKVRGIIEGLDKAYQFIQESIAPVPIPAGYAPQQAMPSQNNSNQSFPNADDNAVNDVLTNLPPEIQ